MTILFLTLASFVAWFISSIAGGGSPFIILPMVNFLLDTSAVPPVVTTGMLISNCHRVWLFWQDIDWRLTWWYLPGAVSGAICGSFAFTQTRLHWLQILLGLFLVSSVFSFKLGKKEQSFQVPGWFFLPAGFVKAFVSGLIGSAGPILNPFYLNYGLVKEKMIATKAAHVLVVHSVKIITYVALGAMTVNDLGYGFVIGLAAIPANYLGQLALKKINEQQFRHLAITLITISGLLILWDERNFFGFW
jgi:uncharacterized membrane protein YfcA